MEDRTAANERSRTREPAGRFDHVSIALHWITAGLVTGQLATAWLVGQGPPGAMAALTAHRSLGLLIWWVVLARLMWRRHFADLPPFPASMSHRQQQIAKLNEFGLYAVLLFQPLTGLANTLFRGRPFVLFGWRAPAILPPGKTVAHLFLAAHEVGAVALLALLGLHLGAALFHEFGLRDGVLRRMLPWTARTSVKAP
ncbi:cytochrome b [Phenylobacterium sp.]|jgi:cytochrome b561|uniref:cytochrome b n=1 Tax=Phenylobacterium sp. TaxID=1871053 RepID=UPI002E309157|nr:cytochrome b/b6 domain-containing protein [Phenylobacterium sp.]HEX3363649.1 cytochrome b/b6 domain-containing protein [Phenylobacterium sp.]